MKLKKRQSLLALALVLLMLLTACGANSKSYDMSMEAPAAEPEVPMEMAVTEEAKMEMEYGSISTADTAGSGEPMSVEEVQAYAEKIIYSGRVYLETTDFDDALLALDQAVKDYNGFVQDSNVSGNTRRNDDGTFRVVDRWATYVVRIPTAKFDEFMAMADGIGNVTSSSRTAENVTSQYTDYEARLSSLRTQEERLLAMLEKSDDLESLIKLEERLSEVRYEIEYIERSLRDLDQRLTYSTVTLELQEVEVYTPSVPVQRTFGEKLSDAFADGWDGFVRSLQRFVIGFARSLPTLVLLAVLAVAVLLAVRRLRRKAKAKINPGKPKNAPEQEEKPE